MNKERKHRIKRIIAFYLAINIFFEVASPSVAFALTSGPGQPEMASFEPVGTTEMVDVFSGDFNYNIPLLTVPGPNGGYPINLAYHSTIGMEDEASWVGLGWNINPGAITRQMRGLPDDFNGEFVKKEMNIRPNRTIAASFGFPISTGNLEVWSLQYTPSFNGSVGLMWNNYQGIGLTTGTSSAMKMSQNNGYTATAGLNMNYNSLSGETDVTPSLSLSKKRGNAENTFGLSYTINSLNGIKDVNFNSSRTVTRDYKNINNARAGAYAASTSFASSSFVPHTDLPQSGLSISAYFKLGADAGGAFANCSVHANYDQTELATQSQDFYSYGYLYSNNRQISASNESSATAYSMMDFNREKDVAPNKDLPTMAVPVSTYDIYMVKGQGVGGIFRPYRTDIGVMGDPMITSTHWGGKLGVDVGPGVPLHVGVNAAISFAKSYTGPWKQDFLWKDIISQTHKG